MMDTPLSAAVDNVIALDEQILQKQQEHEEAMGNLLQEMLKVGKPEIRHPRGYRFNIRNNPANSKLKITRPPKP